MRLLVGLSMKKCSLEVSSIETMGLLDGPGVRVVVFLNRCNLRCIFCHNPESWACKGREYSIDDLFETILKYKNYLKNGGVTFSGGEPLLQSEQLISLIVKLKKENIHVAIDTAGYVELTPEVKSVIELSNLVIMDIKSTNSIGYKQICGGKIELQEDFISYLNTINKEIWIRQVIVPGINDNEQYIQQLNDYIKKIKNVTNVELLGYHGMGKVKYKELNLKYSLDDTPDMDLNRLNELREKIDF